MNPSVASALFGAACFVFGCSSSPLTGEPAGSEPPSGVPPNSAGPVGAGGSDDTAPPALGPTSTFASYPAGPYGTTRGATIENLSFTGWHHPDAAAYDVTKFETVRLSDFYDPDGHSGVKLLAINASAVWCGVCRSEYQDMSKAAVYSNVHPKGVEILGTLFEDSQYYPAQPRDLHNWGVPTSFDVKFPLVLDPGFKMGVFFDSDATPLNMLVDVRTMTIVQVTMGYSATTYWPGVQALLDKM
jgi:AhpC/TSA family